MQEFFGGSEESTQGHGSGMILSEQIPGSNDSGDTRSIESTGLYVLLSWLPSPSAEKTKLNRRKRPSICVTQDRDDLVPVRFSAVHPAKQAWVISKERYLTAP